MTRVGISQVLFWKTSQDNAVVNGPDVFFFNWNWFSVFGLITVQTAIPMWHTHSLTTALWNQPPEDPDRWLWLWSLHGTLFIKSLVPALAGRWHLHQAKDISGRLNLLRAAIAAERVWNNLQLTACTCTDGQNAGSKRRRWAAIQKKKKPQILMGVLLAENGFLMTVDRWGTVSAKQLFVF